MHRLPTAIAIALAFAGTAAAQDERRWNFREDAERASLSWAIPDSDDAGPSFYCEIGEGQLHVLMFVEHRIATEAPRADGTWVDKKGKPAPWPGRLGLRSSFKSGAITVSQDYPMKAMVSPDEMNGGSMVAGVLPVKAAILSTFARGGVIQLFAFGETQSPPPAPVEKVRALLAACGKP